VIGPCVVIGPYVAVAPCVCARADVNAITIIVGDIVENGVATIRRAESTPAISVDGPRSVWLATVQQIGTTPDQAIPKGIGTFVSRRCAYGIVIHLVGDEPEFVVTRFPEAWHDDTRARTIVINEHAVNAA